MGQMLDSLGGAGRAESTFAPGATFTVDLHLRTAEGIL